MHRWSRLSLRLGSRARRRSSWLPSASAFTVTADAPTVTEGNSGTVDAVFTITCEATDVGPITATAAPGSAPAATAGATSSNDEPTRRCWRPCALLPLAQKVTVKVKGTRSTSRTRTSSWT